MSIRGSVTLECDSKGCHAEEVIAAEDANLCGETGSILVEFVASGWVLDDDGELHCPQCCKENPREKGDDDGMEYGHPREAMEDRD